MSRKVLYAVTIMFEKLKDQVGKLFYSLCEQIKKIRNDFNIAQNISFASSLH